MMNNLQIFVLSFGRKKVPTLKQIADPTKVIVLTSTDNEFKDQIEAKGARVMIFDKDEFKGRGLEMMNEESVPHRRSALYGYNYAIEWGRKNGVRYICVLDDDYLNTYTVNNRTKSSQEHKPKLDKWAAHAAQFLQATGAAACSSIDIGQTGYGQLCGYFNYIQKRVCTNTIVFDVEKEHCFLSHGNGDFINSLTTNAASLDYNLRLQTVLIQMETIADKKHNTVDYGRMFYEKWSLVMQQPAYSHMGIHQGGIDYRRHMFNSFICKDNAPKFVSL